jgi:hypothetical protein
VADERRLKAGHLGAHARVQRVGAHDQVEAARLAVLEGDAVAALGELGDGVVEDVVDVVAGGPVEDVDQVAADGLELGDGAAESPSRSAGILASGLLVAST